MLWHGCGSISLLTANIPNCRKLPGYSPALWENSALRPGGDHLTTWSMGVNAPFYLGLSGPQLYQRWGSPHPALLCAWAVAGGLSSKAGCPFGKQEPRNPWRAASPGGSGYLLCYNGGAKGENQPGKALSKLKLNIFHSILFLLPLSVHP